MKTYNRDGSHLIDPQGDLLKTLENCEGHYRCPVGPDGSLLGPVVGYTAEYESGMHWVGLEYFNFAKADPWPAVLTLFAKTLVERLAEWGITPDVIVGAPWAGLKISQEVARLAGCRHVFAEKKGDTIILGRYEGEINRGDFVVVGEELVNNASTTGKLIDLIGEAGGIVTGITCAINRSFPWTPVFRDAHGVFPIIGALEMSTPQFKQNDPVVATAIATGNVVWKPKYAWDQMKAAMDAHR